MQKHRILKPLHIETCRALRFTMLATLLLLATPPIKLAGHEPTTDNTTAYESQY